MSTNGSPNILLIIADDLGRDNVLITDRSPQREVFVMTDAGGPKILGALEYLTILLHNGLEFSQAWAQPACSPTRGSIYTGTWPWRNGVGSPANTPTLDSAAPGIEALPRLLSPAGYESGLFGKWHLGSTAGSLPPDHGWDRHIGTLGGVVGDYELWPKVDSDTGYVVVNNTTYVTRDTVEEAGAWIASVDPVTPWFATIAFHTPHSPFHEPPFGFTLPGGIVPTTIDDMFNAMAQNMDANIGRLLGSGAGPAMTSIDPAQLENTVIIFVGDNGSDVDVATEEEKTTIFEGGVRVPMVIADGHAVADTMAGVAPTPRFLDPGKLDRTSPRMVHVVDLYATIVEVSGTSAAMPTPLDSASLWRFPSRPGARRPVREFNFSQYYTNNVRRATIRDGDYKLNYEHPGQWSMYAYWDGEVPGLEDSTATDIFGSTLLDVQAGTSTRAADSLDALLDELVLGGNYALDDVGTAFPDPR